MGEAFMNINVNASMPIALKAQLCMWSILRSNGRIHKQIMLSASPRNPFESRDQHISNDVWLDLHNGDTCNIPKAGTARL